MLPPGAESALSAIVVGLFMFWSKQKFVTKEDCEKDQDQCSTHVCTKIDDLKVSVKADNRVLFKHMDKNNVFMGRVLQFMKERENGN